MTLLDIILLLCFVPAIILGIRKGFIVQLTSLVSIILGLILANKFANIVCESLRGRVGMSDKALYVVSFIAILIVTILVLLLVGKALRAVIRLVMLGWVDRLLGVVFALLKVGIIVGAAIVAFEAVNGLFHIVDESYLESCVLYYPIKDIICSVFPFLRGI